MIKRVITQYLHPWMLIAFVVSVTSAPLMLKASESDNFGLEGLTTALSCLLEPSSQVKVSSPVPGVVKTLSSERGARVKKGQEIMTLQNGVEKAALAIAQAKAEFSRRKYERNGELLRKGLLSGYERDELLIEKKLGELAVREAQERLKQRTIRSPINGFVVNRYISVGELVGEEPVMELVALNPLHAELVLRGDYYGSIKEGIQVSIEVSGISGKYRGTVTIVDQVIDAASGTFGVQVQLSNDDFALPAGLKCQAVVVEEGGGAIQSR
jgi:membrane fusion protein (multidrug efflux system)